MCIGLICVDPVWIAVFFISLIIAIVAQVFIKAQYGKWSQVRNGPDLSGLEAGFALVNRTHLGGGDAAKISPPESAELRKLRDLQNKGIITEEEYEAKKRQIDATGAKQADTKTNTSSIRFAKVAGTLSDNYDPRHQTVNLSQGVATQHSVAAMAIVAHELGHAQQHESGSALMSMRNVLVPALRFSPTLSYFLILIGLIFNVTGLFWLGVLFYGLVVLFALLTLPVEIDASRRGRRLLREAGLMQTEQDETGTRQVLMAAASTYVAAAITSLLQMLYYVRIGRRSA